MEPVPDKGLAAGRFTLGNLVFVVGKDQIRPTPVQIDGLTQELHGHGTAFQVPSRSPLAPRALPKNIPVLRLVPLP